MAAVRHLGFVKFNFLTVGAIKRPILHQRTKFRKDRSNRCGYITIFVIFNMAAAAILNFQKFEILMTFPPICVIMPDFIKIGQTAAKIWRFNGSKWRPSAILDLRNSKFLSVGAVKRPILHQCTKFRKDRSNRCGDIAIFVIFKMAAAAILNFQKFQILTFDPL